MIPAGSTSNEMCRLKALRQYEVVDTMPEQALDDLTALAAQICGAPIAMISLVEEDRQWFKARVGVDTQETARDISFCGHAVQQKDLFIVSDATLDPRFADNPLVTGDPGIRFYAGAPLLTPEGEAIGSLCVIDHVPRTLTSEQEKTLRILARQVMLDLELRRRTKELVARDEQLRLVTENARVGMVIVNEERRYTYANQAYADILGLDSPDILGKRICDVLPGIYDEQIRPRLDRAFEGERMTFNLHKPVVGNDRHYLVRYELAKSEGPAKLVVVVITDVTESKNAEIASLRLASIVEFSDDAIIGKDLNSIVTSWNKGAEKVFGYTADEMVGTSIMRLIPEGRWDEEDLILGKIRHGESVEHFDTVRRTKSGRLIDVSVTASPIKDDNGVPIGVSKVARDVTDRKKAEQKLMLLSACVARLNDIVLVTEADEIDEPGPKVVFANEAFERITGYGISDVLGKNPRFLQGAKTDRKVLDEIRQALERKEPIRRQVINYGKGGKEYWLDIDIVPILNAEGRCTHFASIQRDITNEKKKEESQKLFRSLMDRSNDAIEVIDPKTGKFIDVNETACKRLGYSREELLTLGILDVALANGAPPSRETEMEEIRKTGFRIFEAQHIRKDGSTFPVEVNVQYIDLNDGYLISVVRDITERKEAEAQILWKTAFFEAQVYSALDGILIVDGDGNKILQNQQMVALWNIPRKFADEADDQRQLKWVADQVKDEASFLNQVGYLHSHPDEISNDEIELKDGRIFDRHSAPVRGQDGKYYGRIWTFRDITERKKAEEAKRASEARYRALFEYAPDGIVIADAESNYIDANASMCRMLGYSREELIGLNAQDIIDFAQVPKIRATLDEIQATSNHHGEWLFRRKNGSIFEAEVMTTVMPDGNLMGMIRDITERKRAEAQIAEQAALLDKAQDAILVGGLDGTILFWNKGAELMYGWTKEEVLGRKVGELIYADPSKFSGVLSQILDKGEMSGEIEHVAKDGRKLMVEARRTLIRDEKGNPKSVLVIYTDVTEKRKVEAQFMRAQRMESIGTLAGGVAHDLNNILAPIMMSIDILKTTADDPQTKQILQTIEVSARRGADIVRQVLSFARGLEGERIEVQPKHLLKDLENIIKDTFPKDIRLKFIIPKDIWTILGDPTQVHQILLNLCVNARDAMPHGGHLTVSVENFVLDEQYAAMNIQAKAGRYVNINVTDTGMGIPAELIEKIFEPFFTTKELHKGTGLGLSTVMAIVKSHNGIVNVYSEPGKGATFKVYLPALEPSLEARADLPAAISLPRGHGETILVVDDEASIRTITGQTLQAFGYQVLTATDGAEAVAVYAQHRAQISVVLTDMMMPVMDGEATIHALMRINPAVKIIAASGLNANGGVAKVSGAGVKHFLTKPYTASVLLKTIRTILEEK